MVLYSEFSFLEGIAAGCTASAAGASISVVSFVCVSVAVSSKKVSSFVSSMVSVSFMAGV